MHIENVWHVPSVLAAVGFCFFSTVSVSLQYSTVLRPKYRNNNRKVIPAYNILQHLQRLKLANSLESRMADGLSEQKKE